MKIKYVLGELDDFESLVNEALEVIEKQNGEVCDIKTWENDDGDGGYFLNAIITYHENVQEELIDDEEIDDDARDLIHAMVGTIGRDRTLNIIHQANELKKEVESM